MAFDLLVIGGGIVGAGAARDAAMRGLSACLVEQNDLAYGTSSRSSKLVHGGLRYLEQGEFSLVFESVSERRVLLEIAPHLVNPLGFIFPVYQDAKFGPLTLNIGMWLYDGLSLFRSPKIHKNLAPRQLAQEEPCLQRDGLRGAQLYYDCATNDARLTLETALDAQAHGAEVRTYTRVTGLLRDNNGRVRGVRARGAHGETDVEIEARAVINATGPWTDAVRAMGEPGASILRTTKGIHIVVPRDRLPLRHAVVCSHPADKRVLFALPWGDRAYIGTTDTDYQGDPAEVAATREDVMYLLDCMGKYFPGAKLAPGDVIATWAGLRPLISSEGSASSVSREHEILVDPSGLITIAGGKLTTFRKMAAEVVDRAVAMLRLTGAVATPLADAYTARQPLPGAVGWPEDDDAARVEALCRAAAPAIDDDTAELLVATYGTRAVDVARRIEERPELGEPLVPGRPERLAQVDFAVEKELAQTVTDVLLRRTQLYYRDLDQGLGAAPRVARRMAALLDWRPEREAAEIAAYEAEVARSRAWKSG
ncbi:MAG: glycerol-3-phosphate dehydrogenase [Deltaproteobacteria bacterium]|nr:glycerol-3-phosphate dehydrogenase [Deltaproteobacteria bacterium]